MSTGERSLGELDDALRLVEGWMTSVSAPLQEIIEDRNYHARAASRSTRRLNRWLLILGGLVACCGLLLQFATFLITVRGGR